MWTEKRSSAWPVQPKCLYVRRREVRRSSAFRHSIPPRQAEYAMKALYTEFLKIRIAPSENRPCLGALQEGHSVSSSQCNTFLRHRTYYPRNEAYLDWNAKQIIFSYSPYFHAHWFHIWQHTNSRCYMQLTAGKHGTPYVEIQAVP